MIKEWEYDGSSTRSSTTDMNKLAAGGLNTSDEES